MLHQFCLKLVNLNPGADSALCDSLILCISVHHMLVYMTQHLQLIYLQPPLRDKLIHNMWETKGETAPRLYTKTLKNQQQESSELTQKSDENSHFPLTFVFR